MSARNLVLFLMFGGFIAGAYYWYQAQTQKPLQAELISIDTSLISRLQIDLPDDKNLTIQLQREEDYWIASNGLVHLRAMNQGVQQLLQNLVDVTTTDIVATDETDWPDFGLGPGQAVQIEIFEGSKVVEHFWLGQVKQATSTGDSVSFIRMHQEKEVYAVDGLETNPFYQTFEVYRPKRILNFSEGTRIDSFSYLFPDTTYSFRRQDTDWIINEAEPAISAQVDQYLKSLDNIQIETFVDDFDANSAAYSKHQALLLHFPSSEKPALIDVYLDTLRELPYVMRSTHNLSAWFGSDSSGVYKRLFWDIASFLPVE